MYLILGLGVLGASILLIAYLSAEGRRPEGARGVLPKWFVQTLFYLTFAGLLFGAAVSIDALLHAKALQFGWVAGVVSLLLFAGFIFAWRAIRRPLPADMDTVSVGIGQTTRPTPTVSRNGKTDRQKRSGRTHRKSAA